MQIHFNSILFKYVYIAQICKRIQWMKNKHQRWAATPNRSRTIFVFLGYMKNVCCSYNKEYTKPSDEMHLRCA